MFSKAQAGSADDSHARHNTILIITPSSTGGGWNMFYRLLKYYSKIDARKENVTVLTLGEYDKRLNEIQKSKTVRMLRIKWLDYNTYVHLLESNFLLNFIFCVPLLITTFLYLLLKRNKITSIISNGFFAAVPALLYKKISKDDDLKVYPWLHTDGRFSEKRIIKRIVLSFSNYANTFFVNSDDVKTDLIQCAISPDKILVVPNWVDTIEINEQHREYSHDYDDVLNRYKFVVTYIGRFVEYKHFLLYLQVAEKTASDNIAFVFIGSGDLEQTLKQAITKNGNIYFFSRIPDEEVRYFLGKSNVTLAYADENYLGLSAYESLVEGTPVIYVDRSCAPHKYFKKVHISKDLVPTNIGFRISESVDDISKLVLSLSDTEGYPLPSTRQECKDYIGRSHHETNAEIILEHLFGK